MNAYQFSQRIYKADVGANEKNVQVFRTGFGCGKVVIANGNVLRVIDVYFGKERAEQIIDKLKWFYIEGQWDEADYYKIIDDDVMIGKMRSIDNDDKWAQLDVLRASNPNCRLNTVTRTEWLKL